MTYNEWRDELKNNLLTVTDAERRRVLDYYAEAYADRREAGFNEREIIEGFGAPYDAAQRILAESSDDYYQEPARNQSNSADKRKHCSPCREQRNYETSEEPFNDKTKYSDSNSDSRQSHCANRQTKTRDDYTWMFVLLCIIFAIPIFSIVMTMVGITIGLCVAPFGVLISGIGTVIAGIAQFFANPLSGLLTLGEGFVTLGVGVIMFPLCFWLVKWMWKLFKMFFSWLKRLFSGKERAQ